MTNRERADEVVERILNNAPFMDYHGEGKYAKIRAKWLALIKQAIDEAVLDTETERDSGSVYDIAHGALNALQHADDLNYPLQLEVERLTAEVGKWEAAFEACNQNLLTHVQQQHPHEYEEMVEVLKREDLLKDKIQSLEAALELTGNAMNVLQIKEKDAEIERLRKGFQEYGIHKMGCHGHVDGPCDCGLEQVEHPGADR